MKADITQVTIGPQEAELLLSKLYPHQRPVTQRHVDRINYEMRAGNWRLSPDMLVCIKGQLANGQHRMHAIIRSKTKQPFLMLNSNDEELYKILDCGRTRSIGDVIGGQYAKEVGSVARLVVLYDLDCVYSGGGGRSEVKATRRMQIEYAEENRDKILPHVSLCLSLYNKYKIVPPNLAATVSFIGTRDTDDAENVANFVRRVYDGESKDDAARDFRERMIRERTSNTKIIRNYVFALMIKSLRSYLQGTRLGTLRMLDGESFPRL